MQTLIALNGWCFKPCDYYSFSLKPSHWLQFKKSRGILWRNPSTQHWDRSKKKKKIWGYNQKNMINDIITQSLAMISLLRVLISEHGFHLSLPFSRMFWKCRHGLWRWIYSVQPQCSCTGLVPVSKRTNVNLLCLPVELCFRSHFPGHTQAQERELVGSMVNKMVGLGNTSMHFYVFD